MTKKIVLLLLIFTFSFNFYSFADEFPIEPEQEVTQVVQNEVIEMASTEIEEIEKNAIVNKSIEDYTVSETYLLLIFLVLLINFFKSLFYLGGRI